MAWHYNKLSEAAEYVCDGIKEALGDDFYVSGKEFDEDDNLIFTIWQTGNSLTGIKFELKISAADIAKSFYKGKPNEDN